MRDARRQVKEKKIVRTCGLRCVCHFVQHTRKKSLFGFGRILSSFFLLNFISFRHQHFIVYPNVELGRIAEIVLCQINRSEKKIVQPSSPCEFSIIHNQAPALSIASETFNIVADKHYSRSTNSLAKGKHHDIAGNKQSNCRRDFTSEIQECIGQVSSSYTTAFDKHIAQ